MKQTRSSRDPVLAFKAVTLGGVVFFSIFGFPQFNGILPLGFNDVMLLVGQPFIMGFMFATFFGKGKLKFVVLTTLALTALGMVLRFVMDQGKTAAVQNFTPLSILAYLGYMTLAVTAAYLVNSARLKSARR